MKLFLHRLTFFMDILFQNQERTVANCDENNIYWFNMLNLKGKLTIVYDGPAEP